MTFPPKRTVRSMISGVRALGQTLTIVPSPGLEFSGAQWYRDIGSGPVAIANAVNPTYVQQAADIASAAHPRVDITAEITGFTVLTTPSTSTFP